MRADGDERNTNLNVQAKNAHDASCMQVVALGYFAACWPSGRATGATRGMRAELMSGVVMAYGPQRDYRSIRDTIPFMCVRLYPARTRYYCLHVQVPSCLYTRLKIPCIYVRVQYCLYMSCMYCLYIWLSTTCRQFWFEVVHGSDTILSQATALVAGVEAQAPTAYILATDDSYVRGVRDAVSRQDSVWDERPAAYRPQWRNMTVVQTSSV
jgi:hypothetical protein